MKYFLITLMSLMVLGANSVQGQTSTADLAKPDAWSTFTSPEADFTVQMPGKPTTRQEPYNQNFSGLFKNFIVFEPSADRRFEVSYVDFKGQLSFLREFQERGLASLANYMTSSGGTVLQKGDIASGNCEGKEIVGRGLNPVSKVMSLVKARTFSSGTVVYMLFYGGASESPAESALADRFLNSFSMIGGCKPVPAESNRTSGFTTVPGTVDGDTGWQRFEPFIGISFLLPGPASMKVDVEPKEINPQRRYVHQYLGKNFMLGSIVYDGYPAPARTDRLSAAAADRRALAMARVELEANRYRVGECRPFPLGTISGFECDFTLPGSELNGRARIFATPTRDIIFMASRGTANGELDAIERFFSSIRIEAR